MNGTLTLDGFCHRLAADPLRYRKLHPVALAGEFVDHFGVPPFPRMEGIAELLDRSGIGTVVLSHETGGLRGYHVGTRDGGYLIHVDASEGRVGQEHTALHEAYEVVRERLHDLHPRIGLAAGISLCRQADRFAAATLMQPYWFAIFAEASGLDVVALQASYGRSYASLTIRLAEVMRHQPLLAVLYERGQQAERPLGMPGQVSEGLRATVVARTPGFRLRMQRRPLSALRGLLPQRGAPPPPGSVAERVALTGRPAAVDRVGGYDLWQADDLAVLARPVIWGGQVAKVSVIAVPYRDRSVLLPQFANASFERIAQAHQVL
ncbi:MAG: hypothetical protein OXL97_06885 [Chloroflexota bacterium]|nr:hypothetical protein [Chloroflexota bacterium]